MTQQINFSPPATVGRFMRSDCFVRVIAGPVGSGKTTGCIFEILRRAIEQAPGPDGIRHTRWAIVRQTLQQLKMTVLLDVLTWLRPIATYRVSDQLIVLRFGDVRAELYLIPLEDPEDQRRLLSMQLTGAWMSEGIEINPDLIPALCGRLGRYPSSADGGPTWHGLIVDTNMPVIGSAWWELMENKTPPDWVVFIQPGGLEPDAENIENLPGNREYYLRLTRGNNPAWIDRYVHARYGEDPSGTAVFKSFKRSFHVRPKLSVSPGGVLIVGQDFGRNPCSLIAQPNEKGQLVILDECIAADIGLEAHLTKSLKPTLWSSKYFGRVVCAVGDPSGVAKSSNNEETSFDVMIRLGIPAFPAPTNDLDARIRAVEALLLQQRGGEAALVIDEERCPVLCRAMQGAYKYGKTRDGQTKPLPDKSHPHSDICDALEYICLVFNSGMYGYMVRKILRGRETKPRRVKSSAGWT